MSSAAFDATDPAALEGFFADLPTPIDHVMVTAGRPYYALLADIDVDERAADRSTSTSGSRPDRPARRRRRCDPAARLVFVGGTGGRRPGAGLAVIATGTAALPALVAKLALELAPIRVNLIAAGFVDTPLSAALLGDELEAAPRPAPGDAADRAGRADRPTSPRSPCTS